MAIESCKSCTKNHLFLMLVGKQHGKAEGAMNFYVFLFNNSRIDKIENYSEGEEGGERTVMHVIFSLNGQEFMATDSNMEHPFTFTEAMSLFVNYETQEEVDELWEKISKGGENQGPGWIKDKYGVSWQIVPTVWANYSTILILRNRKEL